MLTFKNYLITERTRTAWQNDRLLAEAVNYASMFPPDLIKALDGINLYKLGYIPNEIKKAKSQLKREDRIVWFLRIVKLDVLSSLASEIKFLEDPTIGDEKKGDYIANLNKNDITPESIFNILRRELAKINNSNAPIKINSIEELSKMDEMYNTNALLPTIEHFLSLGIEAIDTFTFAWQSPDDIVTHFRSLESEWKRNSNRLISDDEQDNWDVFLEIDKNWVWFDLNTPSCSKEADAMGHCGNSPSQGDSNQTILSLRELVKRGKRTFWKPHLTFILHQYEGLLGETKGFGNDKPTEEYHKYIVPLLWDDRVKGIQGGGYLPENNFSISDLPDDVREKLVDKKPMMVSMVDYIYENGIDDYVKKRLKAEGVDIIDDYIFVDTIDDIEQLFDYYGEDHETSNIVDKAFGRQPIADEDVEFFYDEDVEDEEISDTLTDKQKAKLYQYIDNQHSGYAYDKNDYIMDTLEEVDIKAYKKIHSIAKQSAKNSIKAAMLKTVENVYERKQENEHDDYFSDGMQFPMELSPEKFSDALKAKNIHIVTDLENVRYSIEEERYNGGAMATWGDIATHLDQSSDNFKLQIDDDLVDDVLKNDDSVMFDTKAFLKKVDSFIRKLGNERQMNLKFEGIFVDVNNLIK